MSLDSTAAGRGTLLRQLSAVKLRAHRLDPTVRALIWTAAAGLIFAVLNATMRAQSLILDPYQVQFLRYFLGTVIMLPLIWRAGFRAYIPKKISGHFSRGFVHTLGLIVWFTALPKITMADMTAIGFTGPIFIMIGAYLFFKEPMRWERWLAAGIGFAGVLIVVGPKLSGAGGHYNLIMLASAPIFAASFLMTKSLARIDRPAVIVAWQGITVTLFSLPMAALHWQAPSPLQWFIFLLCGMMGSAAHYCITRSYKIADISATQSVKFLDLVWAALIGWLMFSDSPSQSTLIGGTVICASTIWIAHREAKRGPRR